MRAGQVIVAERDDARAVNELSASLAHRYLSSEDPELLDDLTLLAQDIPWRLRKAINGFRLREEHGLLHIKGFEIDGRRIGPTPSDWRTKMFPGPAFAEEITLLLLASLLGDPFGWQTQQDGRLIHEVFPIKNDENAQLGTSSDILLTWHTEDAFHPARADYVLLFALRNENRVATTVGQLDVSKLDEGELDILFSERFIIRPDNSHLPEYNPTKSAAAGEAFTDILEMHRRPQPVAVLFGDRKAPYIRLDPYFMVTPPGDAAARHALDAVIELVDASMSGVVLEAGDILIIDNLKLVHGRRAFKAKYDGTDRWLKRVNVTRDLRKSRAQRDSATCRLIG